MMKLPPFLHEGSKIAVVTPSGAIDEDLIDKAKKVVEEWGLEVVVAPHAKARVGRYCGTKEERIADLVWALEDDSIEAVLCSRGGYGMVQLLDSSEMGDREARLPIRFSDYPKWIIGYSDITALHAWSQSLGVVSLHAPMAKHIAEEGDDIASASIHNFIFGEIPTYRKGPHLLDRAGIAQGELRGGNLAMLASLRATPYDLPCDRDIILFIEDIGERPYQIERMLLNLKIGGVFDHVSGLIVGQFTDYEEDPLMGGTLFQLIDRLVGEYHFPVCYDFPIGHVSHNFAMPCGMQVELKVDPIETELKFIL